MAIEFHLLTPISREAWLNPETVKRIIHLLVETGMAMFDAPVTVWKSEYSEDEGGFLDDDVEYASLMELHDDIDRLDLDRVNFVIGHSHYSYEHKVLAREGRLPGINLLTAQLKQHMDTFCQAHGIPPAIDVFGHVNIGLINMGGEDGVGETRGVGIYCDGNVAQSMEDAGFLKQLDSGVGIYGLFEKIAAITGEDVAVQFRY